MANIYSNLLPVRNGADGTWSIYATWYDDDDGENGPIGNTEWEVPEWTGLESEKEAQEIIQGYEQGTLAKDLCPRHPHYHT
jgi:hypothetical protein